MNSLIVFELNDSGAYSARIGNFRIDIDGYSSDGSGDVVLSYFEFEDVIEVPCDYGDCPHALMEKCEKDPDLCAAECPSKSISEEINAYAGFFPGKQFREFVLSNVDCVGHTQEWSGDARRMAASAWSIQGEILPPLN